MSYTTPQEGKEDIAPQAPPPLLPGVRYSSFPIIAACLQVRAGYLEVRAGRLEVPGNKLWDQSFQFSQIRNPFWRVLSQAVCLKYISQAGLANPKYFQM